MKIRGTNIEMVRGDTEAITVSVRDAATEEAQEHLAEVSQIVKKEGYHNIIEDYVFEETFPAEPDHILAPLELKHMKEDVVTLQKEVRAIIIQMNKGTSLK